MSATGEPRPKRRSIARRVGWSLWLINLLTLAGLCCWIVFDGRFSQAAAALPDDLQRRLAGVMMANGSWAQVVSRVLYLEMLVALAFSSAIGILASLFVGARTHRRVGSWLAFTFLIALWLTLAVSWRELS
jgi:hypothetical protein